MRRQQYVRTKLCDLVFGIGLKDITFENFQNNWYFFFLYTMTMNHTPTDHSVLSSRRLDRLLILLILLVLLGNTEKASGATSASCHYWRLKTSGSTLPISSSFAARMSPCSARLGSNATGVQWGCCHLDVYHYYSAWLSPAISPDRLTSKVS